MKAKHFDPASPARSSLSLRAARKNTVRTGSRLFGNVFIFRKLTPFSFGEVNIMYYNRAGNYLTPRDNQSHGHSCRRAFPDKICRHICQESAIIFMYIYRTASSLEFLVSSGNRRKTSFRILNEVLLELKANENRFLSSLSYSFTSSSSVDTRRFFSNS